MDTKRIPKTKTNMGTKGRSKSKLLEYLGDPVNDFLNRAEMSRTVLKYKNPRSIYKLFSSSELKEIEVEAMEMRKRASAPQRAMLYKALYTEGLTGNVKAIKEFLDRTEGPVIKKTDNTHSLTHEDLLMELMAEDDKGK